MTFPAENVWHYSSKTCLCQFASKKLLHSISLESHNQRFCYCLTIYSQSSLINNTLVTVHLYLLLHWSFNFKSLIVICYTYCRKRRKKQKGESLKRHKQKKEQEESRRLKEFYSNRIKLRHLQTQAWLQLLPQVSLH